MVTFYKVGCGATHNAQVILDVSLFLKCWEVMTAVSVFFSLGNLGWSL